MAAASPARPLPHNSRSDYSSNPAPTPDSTYNKDTIFPWHHVTDGGGSSSGSSSSRAVATSSSSNAQGSSRSAGRYERESGHGPVTGSTSVPNPNRPAGARSPGSGRTTDTSRRVEEDQPVNQVVGRNEAISATTSQPDDSIGRDAGTASSSESRSKTIVGARRPSEASPSDGKRSDGPPESQPQSTMQTQPHMCLVSYPTQDLITLVASLLQRIAAANDKLRRERVKNAEDDRGNSTSSRPDTSTHTSPPRSPSSRPGPADMVIPPFRPKASSSTSRQLAVDHEQPQAASPTDHTKPGNSIEPAERSIPHGDPIAPHADSGQGPRQTEPDRDDSALSVTHTSDGQPPSASSRQAKWPSTTAAEHAVSHPSSLLCFHARNVPSIGIETYLQRILKYCPVTNDVFISLLVYFDRMSRKLASQSSEADAGTNRGDRPSGAETKGFAIDSYNVHRLVIAGITISSKFHSDVFYTNSRYAKVRFVVVTKRASLNDCSAVSVL